MPPLQLRTVKWSQNVSLFLWQSRETAPGRGAAGGVYLNLYPGVSAKLHARYLYFSPYLNPYSHSLAGVLYNNKAMAKQWEHVFLYMI